VTKQRTRITPEKPKEEGWGVWQRKNWASLMWQSNEGKTRNWLSGWKTAKALEIIMREGPPFSHEIIPELQDTHANANFDHKILVLLQFAEILWLLFVDFGFDSKSRFFDILVFSSPPPPFMRLEHLVVICSCYRGRGHDWKVFRRNPIYVSLCNHRSDHHPIV